VSSDTAKYAKNGLNEERWLDQATIIEMLQIVKMSNIIAFELKACAIIIACFKNVFDVLEAIPKD
jgi:hypothetical protein